MAKLTVSRTLDAQTDALWKLVRDFGDVRGIPGAEHAKLEGSGPGMVRILGGPDGSVRECLESIDEANQSIVYTITEGLPFPVTGYRATMRVSDAGGKGHLDWSCTFEPAGVPEEEAAKGIETMYGIMLGWIEDCLKG
ncbi:MAG: SRPBCC family protein [Myxococcota bacterium]|nr:SRPBCC family protein [Myxococcota bacterium]